MVLLSPLFSELSGGHFLFPLLFPTLVLLSDLIVSLEEEITSCPVFSQPSFHLCRLPPLLPCANFSFTPLPHSRSLSSPAFISRSTLPRLPTGLSTKLFHGLATNRLNCCKHTSKKIIYMEINQVITEPFWVIKAALIKADHANLHQAQWFFKLNFDFDHSTIFFYCKIL